jgi:N-acetyl-anhydromuramyl-L-alanine amidase AmpD
MVADKDTAYHAGNWPLNQVAIGIEHEGFAHKENGWTFAQVRASAALTRWLCLTYRIPMNRRHIIGHVEVPKATHTDPGEFFDWDYYLRLVRGAEFLDPLHPGLANPPPWRKIEFPRLLGVCHPKRGLRHGF